VLLPRSTASLDDARKKKEKGHEPTIKKGPKREGERGEPRAQRKEGRKKNCFAPYFECTATDGSNEEREGKGPREGSTPQRSVQ